MKWIGGVILLIVTIILLVMAVFMFPWFITKTSYEREVIDQEYPNYWDENLGGAKRDWDESTYYLQQYEMKSSRTWNWGKNSSQNSTGSGILDYNTAPKSGGWDGSYRNMVESNYPPPGFIVGGNEQLNVYNFTYYMMIFSIVLACIAIVFVIVSGLEKISSIIPKVIVGIAIIFVIMGPLYFALALPPAIEADDENLYKVLSPEQKQNATHQRPAEAGGIMGEANERDDASSKITARTDFSPGIGWWLAIVAIFTTIITIGFVSGPAPAGASPPDYSRRKYHEFDRPNERDYRDDYGPPPGRGDDYYRDEPRGGRRRDYHEPDQRDRDSYRYDDRGDHYDERGRGEYPPAGRRRAYDSRGDAHRPPPPQQYDYGRPSPRPPRRQGGPPPPRRSRRPPPRY